MSENEVGFGEVVSFWRCLEIFMSIIKFDGSEHVMYSKSSADRSATT